MSPLEQEIQNRIAKEEPKELEKWTNRFIVAGAVYFLLGGREVRLVVGAGTAYYLVQKKVIQTERQKAIETLEEAKKRLFGGK